jgi:hypothetical protein
MEAARSEGGGDTGGGGSGGEGGDGGAGGGSGGLGGGGLGNPNDGGINTELPVEEYEGGVGLGVGGGLSKMQRRERVIAYEEFTYGFVRMAVAALRGRGSHSFPFPLNLSLLSPFPLNLSLLCPPYDPN